MWITVFLYHCQFWEESLLPGSPTKSLLLQLSRTLSVQLVLEFLSDCIHNPTEVFLEHKVSFYSTLYI